MADVAINFKMYEQRECRRTRMQLNPLNQMMETEKIRARPLLHILNKHYVDTNANPDNPPDFPEEQLTRQFGSPGCHDSWLDAYEWIVWHIESLLQEIPANW